jgi:formate hydrogenlyase subunit 4
MPRDINVPEGLHHPMDVVASFVGSNSLAEWAFCLIGSFGTSASFFDLSLVRSILTMSISVELSLMCIIFSYVDVQCETIYRLLV